MYPTPDYLPSLKKTGTLLLIVGILDLGLMLYTAANQVSYPSSLSFFALIASFFLVRGNLRAASVIRWLALFFLAFEVSMVIISPLRVPLGLLVAHSQAQPLAALASIALLTVTLGLSAWVARQLSAPPVVAACLATGAKVGGASVPVAVGIGLAVVFTTVHVQVQRSESATRAVDEARTQLGNDYDYYVSSINYHTTPDGSTVSGVVTAWKRGEIQTVPFQWRE